MSSQFEVSIQGKPLIRSIQDVTAGKSPTGFMIRVKLPEGWGPPYIVERDFFDTESLNRAMPLYKNGPTVVTVPEESLTKHTQTWRDEVISVALEQFATRSLQSSPNGYSP